MTRNLHMALGVVATLGLALAASAAIAHSPGMGGGAHGGMGEHAAMPGSKHGGMGGSMHGMHARMHSGSAGSAAGGGVGQELMAPEERDAMREKMASAKTPQQRQALAAGMRAEMEKRAKERGIAMPEHGARGGMGMQQGSGSGHRH